MNFSSLVITFALLGLVSTTPMDIDPNDVEVKICCDYECGHFDVIKIGRRELPYVTYAEFDLMSAYVEIVAGDKDFCIQQQVAEAIINRTLSDRYPDYIDEVIYQKGYYGLWKYIPDNVEMYEVEVSDSVCEAVTEALYNPMYEDTLNIGLLVK